MQALSTRLIAIVCTFFAFVSAHEATNHVNCHRSYVPGVHNVIELKFLNSIAWQHAKGHSLPGSDYHAIVCIHPGDSKKALDHCKGYNGGRLYDPDWRYFGYGREGNKHVFLFTSGKTFNRYSLQALKSTSPPPQKSHSNQKHKMTAPASPPPPPPPPPAVVEPEYELKIYASEEAINIGGCSAHGTLEKLWNECQESGCRKDITLTCDGQYGLFGKEVIVVLNGEYNGWEHRNAFVSSFIKLYETSTRTVKRTLVRRVPKRPKRPVEDEELNYIDVEDHYVPKNMKLVFWEGKSSASRMEVQFMYKSGNDVGRDFTTFLARDLVTTALGYLGPIWYPVKAGVKFGLTFVK